MSSGLLWCAYFKRDQEIGAAFTEEGTQMNVKKAHRLTGHHDKNHTRKIAKVLGWVLKPGELPPCKACSIAVAKQHAVCKDSRSESKATRAGERLFSDLATIRAPVHSGIIVHKTVWHMTVCHYMGYCELHFYRAKNDFIEKYCASMQQWKQNEKPVKFVLQDNAGENRKLIERANKSDWKLNITPEYTGRDTP